MLDFSVEAIRMQPTPPKKIHGYSEPQLFKAKGIEHYVYHSQADGPPVLLLHELTGLNIKCRQLADRLSSAGFRVFMPLLFGPPEKVDLIGNTVHLCISKEFHAFAANQTQPLVSWLQALVTHIAERESTERVGVIGMCLTGNFALTLIAHANVRASVCCQPSMPFFKEENLAMSPTDLREAVDAAQRLGKGSMIGFRYQKDWICPAARFQSIRKHFGDCFDGEELPGCGHATLTNHLHPKALEKTIRYLQASLM